MSESGGCCLHTGKMRAISKGDAANGNLNGTVAPCQGKAVRERMTSIGWFPQQWIDRDRARDETDWDSDVECMKEGPKHGGWRRDGCRQRIQQRGW